MDLSRLDQVLWLASAALAAAIIARILQQGLFRSPLKSFAWMLGVVLMRDATLSVPRYNTHAYAVIWEWTLPALLAAQLWAGFDTLRAIARLYPKIGKFAVRLFLACLAITVIVCCLSLPFELHRLAGPEALLRSLFLLHRCVDSWIAGTLILVAVFFARSPAPLRRPPRNLVMHTLLLSLYFGGYAALFLAENLAPLGAVATLERVQFGLVILLYTVWLICLSRSGENRDPWPQMDIMLLRTVEHASQARRSAILAIRQWLPQPRLPPAPPGRSG